MERWKYTPLISSKMKSIYNKIKKEYPYVNLCIWNTSFLNEFMVHQPGRLFLILEGEKEVLQSLFYYIKEMNQPVFIEPTNDILDKYVPADKQAIIIKRLVSEAPVLKINGFNTISLEKMLVDVYCNDVPFSAHQGAEMRTIFSEVFTKYVVNNKQMLRYAKRRGKKKSMEMYLTSIPNYISLSSSAAHD